jgi:Putative transposase/Transposase zinc-binding domain
MPELADIVRRHGPAYLQRHQAHLPLHHRKALRAIVACRTPALGGHLYACAECAHRHFAYHSCNHRSCPKCGGAAAAAWRERRLAELLPVPYFLITFTLPAELRTLCQKNQRFFYTLLFNQSAQTLKEIAAQPRHLGGELGFFGVLHSWSRQLAYHPHVHYVVPGGGVRADHRQWRRCRQTKTGAPFLLPVRVLSQRFRNRFATHLREKAPHFYDQLPASVWRKCWVVHSQPAGSAEQAVRYLSGYVQRTALSNQRILAEQEGRITLGYTQSATKERKTLQLDADTFIARILAHVLPPGFHKVRSFGWLHPRAKARLLKVQTLLAVPLIFRPQNQHSPVHLRCVVCGKPALVRIGRLRRPRPPRPPPRNDD